MTNEHLGRASIDISSIGDEKQRFRVILHRSDDDNETGMVNASRAASSRSRRTVNGSVKQMPKRAPKNGKLVPLPRHVTGASGKEKKKQDSDRASSPAVNMDVPLIDPLADESVGMAGSILRM